MGIIEEILAEFELENGERYRIEYNTGDVIHVHIDSIRIDMSVDEFRSFVSAIDEGMVQLMEEKDL